MQVTEMASLIRLEREAREAARFAGIDSGGHIMCFGELLQRALSTAPSPDIVAPAAVHSDRGRILLVMAPISRQCMQHWRLALVATPTQTYATKMLATPPQPPDASLDLFFPADYPLSPPSSYLRRAELAVGSTRACGSESDGTGRTTITAGISAATSARTRQFLVCVHEYLLSLGCAGHADWHPAHAEPPPREDGLARPIEYEKWSLRDEYDRTGRDVRRRRRRRCMRLVPRCTALRLVLRGLPALAPQTIPSDTLAQHLALRQHLLGAAQRADVLYLALGAAPQAATPGRAHGGCANYQHFPDALRRLLASHAKEAKNARHRSADSEKKCAQPLPPLKVEIVLFDSASMLKHARATKRHCGRDLDIDGDGSEPGGEADANFGNSSSDSSSMMGVLCPPPEMHCISGHVGPTWSAARGHWRSVRPRGALHVGQVLRVPTHEEVARAQHEQALDGDDAEDGGSDASFADAEAGGMSEAQDATEHEVERRSWCYVAAAAHCTARARSGSHLAVDWDEDKERVLGGTVRVLECSGPDCDDDDTVLLQLLRPQSTKACDNSGDAVQHHFAWLPRECLLRWSGRMAPSASRAQQSTSMLRHGKLGDDGYLEGEWHLRGSWKAKTPANSTDGSGFVSGTDSLGVDVRVSAWRGVWQPYRHAAFLQCVAEELQRNADQRSAAVDVVHPDAGEQHRVMLPRLLIGCYFSEVDGKRTDLCGLSGGRSSASVGTGDSANDSDVHMARSDSLVYAELAAVARMCPLVSLISSGSGGRSTLCECSSGVASARKVEWEWRERCRRQWCAHKVPPCAVDDATIFPGAHAVFGAEVEGDTVWAAMLRRLWQRGVGDGCEARAEEQRPIDDDDEPAAVAAVTRVKAAERPELSRDDWARMQLGSTAVPALSTLSGGASAVAQVSGCCDIDVHAPPWQPSSWAHLHGALSAHVDAEDQGVVPMPREHCSSLSADRFAREYEDANIPVVIDGLCDTWNFLRLPASPSQVQAHAQSRAQTQAQAQVPTPAAQPQRPCSEEDTTVNHVQYLTFEQLYTRFPGTQWRFSDTHGETMSIEQYAAYVRAQESVRATAFGPADDAPLGLYDSQFGEQRPTDVLLDEYTVPPYFRDDLFRYCSRPRRPTFPVHVDGSDISRSASAGTQRIRPPFRWILVGPARSGTGLHVDPLWTSAWVTLLSGLKRWVLFPPQVGCDERVWGGGETVGPVALSVLGKDEAEDEDRGGNGDGGGDEKAMPMQSVHWFMQVYPKLKQEQQLWQRREERGEAHPEGSRPPPLMVELLQRPGQTVFVPQGWPHAVLNLSMSVALTHNFGSARGTRTAPTVHTASGTAGIARRIHSGAVTAVAADAYGHGRPSEALGGFTGICRACARDEPVFGARLYRRLRIGRADLADAARNAGLGPKDDEHLGLHDNDSLSTTTTASSSGDESESASVSEEEDL